jgi:hypothetical protein
MKPNNFLKVDLLILVFVLVVGLALRLYKISTPLADFHSWRQVDTAAVARNFVADGFDLMKPRYDDLSNVQSGMDNPEGLRMVEFPLYNAMFAGLHKAVPSVPLEVWGRLVSIFFSLIIIAVIYYLLLKEVSRLAAVFAALIYAVFPFFVFFSRVVLPESTALGFSFISIFLLYVSLSPLTYIPAVIFFAASLLIKPTVIFFALPLAYIFFKNHKWAVIKRPYFYVFFILSAIPLFLWRNYIQNFPEGVPGSEWLITSVNTTGALQRIFFRPAFFRWIFFERINNLILGGLATSFFILGCFARQKKGLMFSILAASLSFVFVFQGGNVQHEYYQTLILPALAIFTGIGIDYLLTNKKTISTGLAIVTIPVILALSWFFSYYTVRGYYNYPSDLIQTAKIINSLTSPKDLVVTDTTGDTTLLYLSERRGAPAVYRDPKVLKELGYSIITTNSQDMVKQLEGDNFELLFENEKLSIFKL